jgi:mono/diheme cytochrome c family protein
MNLPRLDFLRFMVFCAGLACATAGAVEKGTGGERKTYDLHRDTVEASVVRGSIVFRTYCVLCHGSSGEGNGRAAARYAPPPANLVASRLSDGHKEAIVRGGGQSVGRSPFMPPWGEELTEEQIRDLIVFLRAINRPAS